MNTFRQFLEAEQPTELWIRVLSAFDHRGTAHGPGGEYDTADLDDYTKHLNKSPDHLLKNYQHDMDFEYTGKQDLPAIPGIHHDWQIFITPEVDHRLYRHKAIWHNDYNITWYHDSRNDAEVFVRTTSEELQSLIRGIKDPNKNVYQKLPLGPSDTRTFQWKNLHEIIKKISEEQKMPPPQNMPLKPQKIKSADPRTTTSKRPGEDRESWMNRSLDINFGKPKMPGDTYNPNDRYYKAD